MMLPTTRADRGRPHRRNGKMAAGWAIVKGIRLGLSLLLIPILDKMRHFTIIVYRLDFPMEWNKLSAFIWGDVNE